MRLHINVSNEVISEETHGDSIVSIEQEQSLNSITFLIIGCPEYGSSFQNLAPQDEYCSLVYFKPLS